jgi:hypothetical protein
MARNLNERYHLGIASVDRKVIMNKHFWKELIAYFPLIRHGLHRKRLVQQFYYHVYIPSSLKQQAIAKTPAE